MYQVKFLQWDWMKRAYTWMNGNSFEDEDQALAEAEFWKASNDVHAAGYWKWGFSQGWQWISV